MFQWEAVGGGFFFSVMIASHPYIASTSQILDLQHASIGVYLYLYTILHNRVRTHQ